MNVHYITYLNSKKKAENTIKSYTKYINQMLNYIGKAEKNITSLDLVDWQNSISNLSSATVNLELSAVKNYFRFLNMYGVISENPAMLLEGPKRENKVKEYMSKDMVKAMINVTTNPRNKAIVMTYASTGMRVSELTGITMEQYITMKNNGDNFITIVSKGNKARKIYFNPQTMGAIEEYIKVRPVDHCGKLFLSNCGNMIDRKNLSETLKTIAHHAGIKNWESISNHSMRAATASIMSEMGVPVAVIRDTLGHSSISTTNVYVKTNTNQVNNAVNNMVF